MRSTRGASQRARDHAPQCAPLRRLTAERARLRSPRCRARAPSELVGIPRCAPDLHEQARDVGGDPRSSTRGRRARRVPRRRPLAQVPCRLRRQATVRSPLRCAAIPGASGGTPHARPGLRRTRAATQQTSWCADSRRKRVRWSRSGRDGRPPAPAESVLHPLAQHDPEQPLPRRAQDLDLERDGLATPASSGERPA